MTKTQRMIIICSNLIWCINHIMKNLLSFWVCCIYTTLHWKKNFRATTFRVWTFFYAVIYRWLNLKEKQEKLTPVQFRRKVIMSNKFRKINRATVSFLLFKHQNITTQIFKTLSNIWKETSEISQLNENSPTSSDRVYLQGKPVLCLISAIFEYLKIKNSNSQTRTYLQRNMIENIWWLKFQMSKSLKNSCISIEMNGKWKNNWIKQHWNTPYKTIRVFANLIFSGW